MKKSKVLISACPRYTNPRHPLNLKHGSQSVVAQYRTKMQLGPDGLVLEPTPESEFLSGNGRLQATDVATGPFIDPANPAELIPGDPFPFRQCMEFQEQGYTLFYDRDWIIETDELPLTDSDPQLFRSLNADFVSSYGLEPGTIIASPMAVLEVVEKTRPDPPPSPKPTPNIVQVVAEVPDPGSHPDEYACDVFIPYKPGTRESWLRQAIDSALNQNHVHTVVHVIRDGGPRERPPGLAGHYRTDRVQFHYHTDSVGPYVSLNRYVHLAQSEFIAIQDSDDISLPNRLWSEIHAAHKHDADVVGGKMQCFLTHEVPATEDLKDKRRSKYTGNSGHREWDSCPDGYIANPTMIVRASAFRELNGFTSFRGSGDVEWVNRALLSGLKVIAIPNTVVLYRIHGTSLSQGGPYGIGSPYREAVGRRGVLHRQALLAGADPKHLGALHTPRNLAVEEVDVPEAREYKRAVFHQWIPLLDKHWTDWELLDTDVLYSWVSVWDGPEKTSDERTGGGVLPLQSRGVQGPSTQLVPVSGGSPA